MFKSQELLNDINRLWREWDERGNFTLKGVKNLSPSDLDTLKLYAETGGESLMTPLGEVGRVLEKYGYR